MGSCEEKFMKLGFFSMSMHPLGKDLLQSLREDQKAFILADELSFPEGYVGEHATEPEENIAAFTLFLATLVGATQRMKLGTGTLNLPSHDSAAVSGNVAMLDPLLGKSFIRGITPGALLSDAEVFGNMDLARPAIFLEAINQLLLIWSIKPFYNFKGHVWNITTERTYIPATGVGTLPWSLQHPHPPILVTAVTPFSRASLKPRHGAGIRSRPISFCHRGSRANGSDMSKAVTALNASPKTLRSPRPSRRVPTAHTITYRSLFTKLNRRAAPGVFKSAPEMPDYAVTLEQVVDQLLIDGTPTKAADGRLAMKQETGEFGTTLYARFDWTDRAGAQFDDLNGEKNCSR